MKFIFLVLQLRKNLRFSKKESDGKKTKGAGINEQYKMDKYTNFFLKARHRTVKEVPPTLQGK